MLTSATSTASTQEEPEENLSSDQLDALMRDIAALPPGPRRTALRDLVIQRLLPLARRVARRFRARGEDLDDLVQVASLGVLKAVDGYDHTRGHAFLSYALPTVVGELKRHLRDRTTAVRLPRPLQEARGQVFQAAEELEQQLGGRSPTPEQIAAHTGLDPRRVVATLRAVRECSPRSLDAPAAGDEGSSLESLVGCEDRALDLVVDTVALSSLLERLPDRDRYVLYLRFYRDQTQHQIAETIGVSQMQVSRILMRCFTKLRQDLLTTEPPAETDAEPRARQEAADRPAAGRPPRTAPRLRRSAATVRPPVNADASQAVSRTRRASGRSSNSRPAPPAKYVPLLLRRARRATVVRHLDRLPPPAHHPAAIPLRRRGIRAPGPARPPPH
ncbi:SigB/SigF/SigG family RNA polymerase sigma factor [Streptomyces sp. NPDC057257]|uniref:SigB/SigF/SigG family RNA polymerase sigma factor n=1 Tax=Streptomyces sp. NPDC057257 TaxID=3346071 RepID=UPI0036309337